MCTRSAVGILILIGALGSALAQGNGSEPVPIIGGPCDGCEEVFVGIPGQIGPDSRLTPADQPGEALRIEGVVRDSAGKPAAGIVVYAYQTDAEGIYPNARRGRGETGARHGDLRGWARTDAQGRYSFDTIRPASYPRTSIPQHVHMHVIEPDCCTYYIGDIYFDDDPLLGERTRARQAQARGGSGLATPSKDASGRWQVTRDIVLGERIPGYAEAKE